MIAWLLAFLAFLAFISGPATATQPAQRLTPPGPWTTINAWADGCTYTRIDTATITATHCRPNGYSHDGDIATTAPVHWANPTTIAPGTPVYAIGYPAQQYGQRITYTLTALTARTVTVYGTPQLVLMTKGAGIPCTAGASGMIAWALIDGTYQPIGPMSVYSTDPTVTGLPAGEYVCGFAI